MKKRNDARERTKSEGSHPRLRLENSCARRFITFAKANTERVRRSKRSRSVLPKREGRASSSLRQNQDEPPSERAEAPSARSHAAVARDAGERLVQRGAELRSTASNTKGIGLHRRERSPSRRENRRLVVALENAREPHRRRSARKAAKAAKLPQRKPLERALPTKQRRREQASVPTPGYEGPPGGGSTEETVHAEQAPALPAGAAAVHAAAGADQVREKIAAA